MTRCEVTDNWGSEYAGGIVNEVIMGFTDRTVARNSSDGACGGGITSSEELTLGRSRVEGSVGRLYGGIFNSGVVEEIASTVANNPTWAGGAGGGIYGRRAGRSHLTRRMDGTSVFANEVTLGGSIANFGRQISFEVASEEKRNRASAKGAESATSAWQRPTPAYPCSTAAA